MNVLIIVGFLLAGGVIIADRFLKPIPEWVAIVLYAIAGILILTGMVISKPNQPYLATILIKNIQP